MFVDFEKVFNIIIGVAIAAGIVLGVLVVSTTDAWSRPLDRPYVVHWTCPDPTVNIEIARVIQEKGTPGVEPSGALRDELNVVFAEGGCTAFPNARYFMPVKLIHLFPDGSGGVWAIRAYLDPPGSGADVRYATSRGAIHEGLLDQMRQLEELEAKGDT